MRIRVVSYNIHRAIGVDRRFRPERIVSILSYLAADLVLLQEVDEGAPRSRELDLARELARSLGYPHVAVGHNVALRRGRYGNATLSRFPILRERNIDLTIGLRKRRGCQHTRLLVKSPGGRGHRVEAFNLHLGLSARERREQVQSLARSRELAALPEGVACLVGGDFNDWRSLMEPTFEGELGFRSANGGDSGAERRLKTYPSFFPQGALDRIYFRGPLRLLAARPCRLGLCRVASDHLPLVADLELHG
jgi:endonuclease/exonuclease/phosphatase family metal-dependent hydrolase